MPRITSEGLEFEYDTFGAPENPAILLVMGLGAQMTAWHADFCRGLAERGFFVIRYDNRDCGLSTSFDAGPAPDIGAILAGDTSSAPYRIADMADDAVRVLDALNIEAAHIVGASMGGMIAQELAIGHPKRVRTLCSIMSTTGDRSVGRASREALTVLAVPPVNSREEAVEQGLRTWSVLGSPGYPEPAEQIRERLAAAYERSYRPEGFARQYAAVLASPDRTARLSSLTCPTLVIHGTDDPLIDRSGGEATAAAVPGAELLLLPGMGHDLPKELWPVMADAIARTAARVAAPSGSSDGPAG